MSEDARATPAWRAALRLVAELALSAVVALGIAVLLQQSGLYQRVRWFPDAVPGLAWKDLGAFALPFLALVWVFVVRRGATTALVGLVTAIAVVVGHAWSNLDWTRILWPGVDLAHGGLPPAALVGALVAVFALVAAYHVLDRRAELRLALTAKGAEADDVEAARRVATRHSAAVLGWALALAAVAAGGVLAAAGVPLLPSVGGSGAVVLGLGSLFAVGVAVVAVPPAVELVRRMLRPSRTEASEGRGRAEA